MAMIFSLGTRNHEVFIFRNLVENSKGTTMTSLSEFKNIVYSSEVAEFDRDLYNDAISLPAFKSTQPIYDSDSSPKYKFGSFEGKNIYKDSVGTIDTSLSYSGKVNGWLTPDNSTSDYCLFSASTGESFYIATKDFSPGLIVSDFRPLYYKLMAMQLNKYNSPRDDTHSSSSGIVSFKTELSFLVNGAPPVTLNSLGMNGSSGSSDYRDKYDSWKLSLNSVLNSAYYNLKLVRDSAFKAATIAADINRFGTFIESATGEDIANAIVENVPLLSTLKSTGLSVYDSLSSIKESLSFDDSANNSKKAAAAAALNAVSDFNKSKNTSNEIKAAKNTVASDSEKYVIYKGKNIKTAKTKTGYLPANLLDLSKNKWSDDIYYSMAQCIIYPVSSSKYSNVYFDYTLFCYQQPESISYNIDSSYEPQSPRGSQAPYQFYQSTGQISLTFDLKWHLDEVLENNNKTLQEIADLSEFFARPWDNGNGSITPKLCKVILPSISEIGYISSVNISYSGDMAGETNENGAFNDVKATGSERDTSNEFGISESTHKSVYYTYNFLTITFTMLVIRDVKLLRLPNDSVHSKDISDNTSDGDSEFDFSDQSEDQSENEGFDFSDDPDAILWQQQQIYLESNGFDVDVLDSDSSEPEP